jgi:chromatin remodeling complex protein RSC6
MMQTRNNYLTKHIVDKKRKIIKKELEKQDSHKITISKIKENKFQLVTGLLKEVSYYR